VEEVEVAIGEKGGYSPALISARSRLRELDSNMFEFYMTLRNVSHG